MTFTLQFSLRAGLALAVALSGSIARTDDQTTIAESRVTLGRLDQVAGSYLGAPRDSAARAVLAQELADVARRLEPLVSSDQHGYTAAFLLARAHYMEYNLDVPGSFESTVKAAEEALRHEPDRREPYDLLGAFYANCGHGLEAVECYWNSLWRHDRSSPLSANLLAGLTQAYLMSANGLWAFAAARACEVLGGDTSVVKSLMIGASAMTDQALLEAVTIEFATEGISYSDRQLGYEMTIPPGWRMAREGHEAGEDTVGSSFFAMALPPVVGERVCGSSDSDRPLPLRSRPSRFRSLDRWERLANWPQFLHERLHAPDSGAELLSLPDAEEEFRDKRVSAPGFPSQRLDRQAAEEASRIGDFDSLEVLFMERTRRREPRRD